MTQDLTTQQPVQIRVLEELKKDNRLPALIAAVESVKAPEAVKEEVVTNFADFFERIERYVTPAFALVVADETEKEKMFDAAQAVTALKGLEKSLTAKHGELKEDALRYGQTLDAAKRAALALITPAVEHLKAQAEYIERKEAARVEALRSERYNLILPYLVPEILPTPYPVWGEMHEDDFQATLAAAKDKARQIEAERVARIEKEKAEKEELERLRVETAAKDAQLLAEKELRERTERENEKQRVRYLELNKKFQHVQSQSAEALQQVEEYKKQLDADVEEEANALIANLAPQTDREKLRAYGVALLQVPCAPIQDPAMRKVLQDVKILLTKVNDYIEKKIAQ
jgi:hypothetical protein